MTEILTAIITLLGTLAVAGLGFLQWQRMQVKDRQKGYHDQRVEALSSVWNILADVEATQRTDMNESREPQRTEPLRSVICCCYEWRPSCWTMSAIGRSLWSRKSSRWTLLCVFSEGPGHEMQNGGG
jgi:hypothetical protein